MRNIVYYCALVLLLHAFPQYLNAQCEPSTEVCDGVDNDCDGEIDEGFDPQMWFSDNDGDGYGAYEGGITVVTCDPPEGFVNNYLDCNDFDPSIHPGAIEVCDGQDNDCNGSRDDGLPGNFYYYDNDGDGYGGDAGDPSPFWVTDCELGNLYGISLLGGDWDDENPNSYPGAPEVCDDQDNNRDGAIDEGFTPTYPYYEDYDGDGFGNDKSFILLCEPGLSSQYPYRAEIGGDCDDTDNYIYPGAEEYCDGRDNNCDGEIDETSELKTYYFDLDQDGYGSSEVAEVTKTCYYLYYYHYSLITGDCNDNDRQIYPGAAEICDGVDNDCDVQVDDECEKAQIISINGRNVTEADGFVMLTVSLSTVSNRKIKVFYTTIDGTAVSKGPYKDFIAQSGTVTIPAGKLTATIKILIIKDDIEDSWEGFTVQLSKPQNASILNGTGYVTIADWEVYNKTNKVSVSQKVLAAEQLSVTVAPNPTQNHFSLKILGKSDEKVIVRILDVMGRIVETRTNITANTTITLGNNYRPGLYYTEVMQGKEKVILKLIKQ